MIPVPASIQQFITAATVCGNMYLPFHYPALAELEGYQSGFRYHGITGEDLTSTEEGQWQPGWYVIALNGLDDPFFIDLTEEDKGFPVYYAPHGAGRWKAETIAGSIEAMQGLLKSFKEMDEDQLYSVLTVWKDLLVTTATVDYLPDLENSFWKELYEYLEQNRDQKKEEPNAVHHPNDWERGQAIVTHMGPGKIRVINFLKERLDLSLQEAVALSKQPEIMVEEGYRLHLKKIMDQLTGLGATVIFRLLQPVETREIITANGHRGNVVLIRSLLDKLHPESDYHRYRKNHEGWLDSKAVYFKGHITVDSLDLDNPFNQVPADWQQRYDEACDADDRDAQRLLWEEYNRQLIRMVLVEGNLTVNRYIINDETDGASGLLVSGNLHCPNIVAGGQEIFVQGNLTVPGLYWGHYNHGGLGVLGSVQARVFIETDEYRVAVKGILDASHHWDNDAFVERAAAIQNLLTEACFDDPQGTYPTEILSRYAMQQCLRQGKPLLKTSKLASERLFNDYTLSPENLRTLCSLSIIREEYFHYKIEDVNVQLECRHIDAEGKAWPPSIRLEQDGNKVFACMIERQQELNDDENTEPSFAEHLKVLWQAPDNNWYYVDQQTPQTHRNLLTYFLPRAIHRAEHMEKLNAEIIATCRREINSTITPEKVAWYLSRPIVTQLYNDYYDSDKNGYWSGSIYFAFRQNDDTYCDRIQLVKERNPDELKYYPSVTNDYDVCGYRFDLETDKAGAPMVTISYQPHDGGSAYPLTPLDADHYQQALKQWQYFETAFTEHNKLFEAGRWLT